MPYKLRKAPKKALYWVVTTETGKKHSKLPIPMDKAKAQMRILESALKGGGRVTQQKLRDLKKEYIEVVQQIQQEHQKMVNYAIAEDIETMDTLDLPISDKYKKLNKLKTKIEQEHKKWLSIEKKEAQDAIPEEDEEEEEEEEEIEVGPTEAASSGLSAVRMLRKKMSGKGVLDDICDSFGECFGRRRRSRRSISPLPSPSGSPRDISVTDRMFIDSVNSGSPKHLLEVQQIQKRIYPRKDPLGNPLGPPGPNDKAVQKAISGILGTGKCRKCKKCGLRV